MDLEHCKKYSSLEPLSDEVVHDELVERLAGHVHLGQLLHPVLQVVLHAGLKQSRVTRVYPYIINGSGSDQKKRMDPYPSM